MRIELKEGRGNNRVFARMSGPTLERSTRRGIRQAWFAIGRDMKAEANREILRRPKGGRLYIIRDRSGRRRRHRASAPGETHANRTGALRRALSWKVSGTDHMDFGYGQGTKPSPNYASFVEFGTRRMEPRPSLQNAIKARERYAGRIFEEQVMKAWKP